MLLKHQHLENTILYFYTHECVCWGYLITVEFHINCPFLWLVMLHSIMSSGFFCCHTCQISLPFYGRVIAHGMSMLHFLYPLICLWTTGLFPRVWLSYTAKNTDYKDLFSTLLWILLDILSEMELLNHMLGLFRFFLFSRSVWCTYVCACFACVWMYMWERCEYGYMHSWRQRLI